MTDCTCNPPCPVHGSAEYWSGREAALARRAMSETYTYGPTEFKRVNGKWHNRAASSSGDSVTWWRSLERVHIAMLDALHPAPPVRVTLDDGYTYWWEPDGGRRRWRRQPDDGTAVGLPLAVALDRIVELGGADEVQP